MTEVICINGTFPADVLEFYAVHGVQIPEKDKIYTVRNVIRHTNFKTGFLLNEIQNPEVPISTAFGLISREPTFDIKRFTTLLGDVLEEKELLQEFETVKAPEPTTPLP